MNAQRKRKESESSLNIEILTKTVEQKQTRYKNLGQMVMMGFTISMCALMFGYGLTQISTIPIEKLVEQYDIRFSPSLAQGLLIGIMPFGGIFGAFFFKYLLQFFSRRNAIFFVSIFMIISMILIQITTVQTLFIGRFIQGICIAMYVSLGPIYIRQVVARQLRPQLMSTFSLCKVLGIVIAYSLQNIFEAAEYQYGWRFLLGFNSVFCILQVVIVFFFIPNSPVEMVEKKDFYQARKTIELLYNQSFVEQVLDEMKADYQAEIAKTKPAEQIGELLKAAVSYTKNRKRALLMAIHVQTYRNFIGGNVLVTFSGQIISQFSPALGKYTALIINILQLIFNVISAFVITKKFGRRPLFLIGSLGLTIFDLALALVLLYQLRIGIFLVMCSYMILYGATFLPISWSYPSEIIPAEQSIYPNIISWISLTIVVSVPPIIVGIMPDHNAYPLFFFFGLYGAVGFVYLLFKMVESKGRTYQQIVKQF